MSLTAFLAGNALLVLVLLTWNLFALVSLRSNSDEFEPRWSAGIGIQWRFGAATAALIAVAVALIEAILFGEDSEISEVAAIYSLGALSVAVAHAVISVLLVSELLGRGREFNANSFSDESPWRRPIEWSTVVLIPAGLIAAVVVGLIAWAV